jgi:HK97 family phage portal protein
MCYAQSVTWGVLAAEVSAARRNRRSVPRTRDLAQVVDQHIAWQESGTGPQHAMSLPALFAVVRLIGSIVNQLPLRMEDGSPAPSWLRRPRAHMAELDWGDMLQHVVTSMALHGQAYLLAEQTSTTPAWRLNAVHPGSVQVTTSTTGIVSRSYLFDGQAIGLVKPTVLERDEALREAGEAYERALREGREPGAPHPRYLVHIPYLVTPDHPEGTSPVRQAWQAISGYLKVEAQAANLLDSGTYSGGRLETDHDITAETAKRFRESWVANRASGQIPVLGNGIRYVNDIISPKDAAWIESRLANAQAVASMFGMPPDMLGMTMAGGGSSLSYQNSQDNNRRLRSNCLEGFTSQIEDALSPLLMRPGRNGEEERRLRFDYSEWEATANADTQPEA